MTTRGFNSMPSPGKRPGPGRLAGFLASLLASVLAGLRTLPEPHAGFGKLAGPRSQPELRTRLRALAGARISLHKLPDFRKLPGLRALPDLRELSPRLLVVGAVAVLMLGAGFAGIAGATDQPGFCGSACHEMGPFHSAWAEGPHKDISCIECHVDPGTIARMEHKVVALKEVAAHVKGDYAFPQAEPPSVPSERCKRCHSDVKLTSTGFSHDDHAARGECVMCHTTVGHEVSADSLKEAGVYTASAKAAFDTSKTAVVDGGKANLTGHKSVPCSRCHNMAASKCSDCHKPKHPTPVPIPTMRTLECSTCHATGVKFAFTHPVRNDCGTCHAPKNVNHTWKGECTECHKSAPGVNFVATHPANPACGSCHARPAKHRVGECATCHTNTGVAWTFAHPSSGDCATCHTRPAKHRAGACASCHPNPGQTWAYAHPTSGDCSSCHARPAKHKPGSCTTCHLSPGKSWSFSHPDSGSTCTSCHARPSKHSSATCTSCHKSVGKSWSFSHPGKSATCTSCHNRPSGHSGNSCTSCHTAVGKSWSFSHPGNDADCSACHGRPTGHSAGSCATCHSKSTKWAFRHNSGLRCVSCHKAPAGHYGTTCQSCHNSPGKTWSGASFTHPRIPGGEHSSTSFACTKCHAETGKGPAYFCSCHGNTTGPGGD